MVLSEQCGAICDINEELVCAEPKGHTYEHIGPYKGYEIPFIQHKGKYPLLPKIVINDPVDHPSHYTSDPSGVECITITRHRNFNIGNAIKYLWRAGLKDSGATVQDLEKAIFYLNDEIKRLKNA